MAGNFFKGGLVKLEDSNKIVIDSNEAIKKKLEELRESMIEMEEASEDNALDGFSEGINPVQVSLLVSDENGKSPDFDSFSEGISVSDNNAGNVIHSVSDDAKLKYDEIITSANEEAEKIRNEAREQGYNEGFSSGHDEGVNQGILDAKTALDNEYNQKKQALENEYNTKMRELTNEYDSKLSDLEPMLVDKIMDIIKHVTGVELAGNRETIIGILKSALENMDSGKHYLIHISPVDFENVKNSKTEIAKGTGLQEEDFDLIEDNSVPANGALIESEAGIFDCGLGSQLELLKKKLVLISFE